MRWGLKFAAVVTQAASNSQFSCFIILVIQAQSYCNFKYKICIHDKKIYYTPPK